MKMDGPKRMIKNAAPLLMMNIKIVNYDCAGPRITKNNAFNSKQSFNSIGNAAFQIHPQSPPQSNFVISNGNNNKSIKDDITRIIMFQDSKEGFLRENEETKKIIDIITSDKFNKMKAKINSSYK